MSEVARGPFLQRLSALIAALWVGSQLTVGYLVAPLLFTTLDRVEAGSVAAQLFHFEAIVGVVCAAVLVWTTRPFVKRGVPGWYWTRTLVLWMWACVAVISMLQTFMEPMRLAALAQGTDVGHTADAARFGIMHGISSLIYVVESVLGLVLLWRWPGRSA